MNIQQKYSILSIKHVVTIASGLAIIAQTAAPTITEYIKQFMIKTNIHNLLFQNQYNPYLASKEFNYHLRFKQLLQFFNNFSYNDFIDFDDQINNQYIEFDDKCHILQLFLDYANRKQINS
jgi:hypothetical protein